MIPFIAAGSLAITTALLSLTPADCITVRRGPPIDTEAYVIAANIEHQLAYDSAEDLAYWSKKCGRELNEVEHLEIRSNLVSFIRALLAPGARLQ